MPENQQLQNKQSGGAQGDREGLPEKGTPSANNQSRPKKDQTIEEQRKNTMGDGEGSQSQHGGRFQEKDGRGQSGSQSAYKGEKRTGSESGGGKSGSKKRGNR